MMVAPLLLIALNQIIDVALKVVINKPNVAGAVLQPFNLLKCADNSIDTTALYHCTVQYFFRPSISNR